MRITHVVMTIGTTNTSYMHIIYIYIYTYIYIFGACTPKWYSYMMESRYQLLVSYYYYLPATICCHHIIPII